MGEDAIVKAVSNYGAIAISGVLVALVVWLIKYLIQEQTKDRTIFMGMFQNELKQLHEDNTINAKLNRKSISMQKRLNDSVKVLSEFIYVNLSNNGNRPCTDGVHCGEEEGNSDKDRGEIIEGNN